MDEEEARSRFRAARFARLATVRPDGAPHLVPVVLAVEDDRAFTAVDRKPKRTTELARLRHVEADARVSLLVDHEDEDWDRLWWVRADGLATVVRDGAEHDRGVELLRAKYLQYEAAPPDGPVIVVRILAWRWWSASR